MSIDSYMIEIIHIFNPHLIWIKVQGSGEKKEEFTLEQVGLYGLLPLEISINSSNNTLEVSKCVQWTLAATSLIKKIVSECDIWFTPTFIDRRVSIFDDNIHKYGDIEIKQGDQFKSLSEQLINANLAYQDVCTFHQILSIGEMKTRLNNIQIQDIVKQFVGNFQSRGLPKKVWENVLKKQMSVFFCSQELESALTESNIEKHNNLMIKRVLKNKLRDFEWCKDVEEESSGRASYKLNKSTESQLSSDLLSRKLHLANENKIQDPVETYNNIKKFLGDSSKHSKKFDNIGVNSYTTIEEKKVPGGNEIKVKEYTKINLRLQKLNNLKKSNPEVIKTKELCMGNLEEDKLIKEHTVKKSNTEISMLQNIAYGPPGINPTQIKKNIVPQICYNEPQQQIVNKEIDIESYNIKLGEVESEVNVDISKEKVMKPFLKEKEALENFYSSTKNVKSASSSLLLRKIMRYNKKRILNDSSYTYTSDTSSRNISTLEDTSKDDDSIDEDMAEVLERIDSKYLPNLVQAEIRHLEENKEADTKLKNHVNPFQNIDPNISVFVDKLVTPILMVHSKLNKRIEPVYEMRDVNFNSHIQTALVNMSIKSPMMLQTISWFTVLRGHSLFMISPMGSGKTMGYLPAVCSLVADYSQILLDGSGPIGIIVCATAQSVAQVEKAAKIFLGNECVISCYAGVDDLVITTRLLNKCDLLISTAPALVRIMKASEFFLDLRRLCAFILDDCERLSVVYTDEIKLFLLKIKETMKNRALKELKVQFILASRIWCDFMGPLAKRAPDTVICIGAFQECVLYSKANTSVSFVKPENKIKHVCQFLKGVDCSKRTVIVCRSDDEIKMLTRALNMTDNYIFSCDSTMTVQDLYNFNISWADYDNPLFGPILICCDDNIIHMNITNAHHLIHYSLPQLFSMFCKRFSVLNDHYPSIFSDDSVNVHIKILLEEINIEQLPKIINFIRRCTDSVPDVLNAISDRVLIEKDANKARQLVPICSNILGFGYCPDVYNCQGRHTLFKDYDTPMEWLPKNGVIQFKILHYHSAVSYSARLLTNKVNGIITKYPQTYHSLSMKMSMYYSKEINRKLHGIPKVGDICAFSLRENLFVRCQVIKLLNRYPNGNPKHMLVNLIDEEKLEITRDIYLYYIPDEIKNIKTTTAQVRLANIQPLDKDITFSELAMKHVKKITESEDDIYLMGSICLVIGNCIFIDKLEVCEDLTSLNKTIVKDNVIKELTGKHAMNNVDHLVKLKKLSGISDVQEKESVVIPLMENKKKKSPKANWAHLDINEISCIFLDSAISPDTFFVRHDKFESCMTDLINEIQNYVTNDIKPLTTVEKGELVLAKFPDDFTYERARVDDIFPNDKVKCFFVDSGDWREVPLSYLVAIPEKFIHQLPFQTIECRLVSIRPHGEDWSVFSTNWLCDNYLKYAEDGQLKRLYVKCFTKGQAAYTGGYKYGVVMIDTNSDQDIIINKKMIELNLAQVTSEEIEYLYTDNPTTAQSKTTESLDEDEWEKVPSSYSNDGLSSQSHIFMQKPLRSIPLVGSDEESDDSDRWNIHMTDDLKAIFSPALKQMAEQNKPDRPAIEDNKQKPTSKYSSVEGADAVLNNDCIAIVNVQNESEYSKIIELDSDDLTSSLSSKSEQNQLHTSQLQELRRPKVTWQQNRRSVSIKIQIIVDGDYELEIGDRKLIFKSYTNNTNYGLDLELYGVVDTHRCSHANKGQYVLIKLTKMLPKIWLTLTKDSTIKKWITYDVDNIDTSSDEEVIDKEPIKNIVKSLHYHSDSESDDNEIIDDANFIYKK